MKIIAGNWKMNGNCENLNQMLDDLGNIETTNKIILCVPFTMLRPGTNTVQIGAQDVSQHKSGAYTGEVSADMIAATGAKYVIVGHSECRQYHGDTNEIVNAKATAAINAGLTPIICVGETAAERDAGKTLEIIESGVRESIPDMGDVIVAYEPRWAIGAGITPTDADIADAHALIRKILTDMERGTTPILYGASVKGANAAQIMGISNVDGVLVGGASLKSDDFIPIIKAVN